MDTETWEQKVAQLKALGLTEKHSLSEIYDSNQPHGITGDVIDILHILPFGVIVAGFKETSEVFTDTIQIHDCEPSLMINMHTGSYHDDGMSWNTPHLGRNQHGTFIAKLSEEKIQCIASEFPDELENAKQAQANYETLCQVATRLNPYSIESTACAVEIREMITKIERMIQKPFKEIRFREYIGVSPGFFWLVGSESHPRSNELDYRYNSQRPIEYKRAAIKQVYTRMSQDVWENRGTVMRYRLEGGAEEEMLEIYQAGSMQRYLFYLAFSICDPQNRNYSEKMIEVRPLVAELLKDIDFQKEGWEWEASKILKNEAKLYMSGIKPEPQIEISKETWELYGPRKPDWDLQASVLCERARKNGRLERAYLLASSQKCSRFRDYCHDVTLSYAEKLCGKSSKNFVEIYQDVWRTIIEKCPHHLKGFAWEIGCLCFDDFLRNRGFKPSQIADVITETLGDIHRFKIIEDFPASVLSKEEVQRLFPKLVQAEEAMKRVLVCGQPRIKITK